MAVQHLHSKLLIQAGREILWPLGLLQVGRSRMWVDDHGWWIINVEFQPSGWSRGSYLNVGAQWLWQLFGSRCFEYGYRVAWPSEHRPSGLDDFIEFESEEQFWPEALKLAERAAMSVTRLRNELGDIEAVPLRIVKQGALLNRYPAHHVAIALALCGRIEAARPYMKLAVIRDPKYDWHFKWNEQVAAAAPLLDDLPAFRRHITAVIQEQRSTLRLPEREIILPGTSPL